MHDELRLSSYSFVTGKAPAGEYYEMRSVRSIRDMPDTV